VLVLKAAKRRRFGERADRYGAVAQPRDEGGGRTSDGFAIGCVAAVVDEDHHRIIGRPDVEHLAGSAAFFDDEVVRSEAHHWPAARVRHNRQDGPRRELALGRRRCSQPDDEGDGEHEGRAHDRVRAWTR
jgi:hypothetical protein